MAMTKIATELPTRAGHRPRTGPLGGHGQLDQNGAPAFGSQLWTRMTALDGVFGGRSGISAPTTRAVHLHPNLALGPPEAFIIGTEFAHLHGAPDRSLHATLPPEIVNLAVDRGWGELHPAARQGLRPPTLTMLYSPRDDEEVDAVWQLVVVSYEYARGQHRARS